VAGACRSCGAPIEWAVTEAGKSIPLDLGDADDGNLIELTAANPAFVAVVRMAELFDEPGPRRRTHFVTCPQAVSWRRR
jgi:hypothetical protein